MPDERPTAVVDEVVRRVRDWEPGSRLELGDLEVEDVRDLTFLSYPHTELPEELGALPLERLAITDAPFNGMPSLILKMRGLTFLLLDRCTIGALPESIGDLSSLESLSVTSTGLHALPSSLGDLPNLSTLWVDSNELSELPASLGRLGRLQNLYASRNRIRDLSPIAALELERLEVAQNPIRALPPGLDVSRSLVSDLRGTELPIPPEILQHLDEPRRILDYYNRLGSEEHRALNEAKRFW